MSAFVAISSLALTLGLSLVPGGVLFAPFTLALFLLALAGVLGVRRTTRGRHPRRRPLVFRSVAPLARA